MIPNDSGTLRPGGFAKASILTGRDSEAVVVPMESVLKFAGVTKVFVVEGGKARGINIETGLEGPGWVEVTSTLPEGANVVIDGWTQLADGTPVILRVEKEKAIKTPTASKPPAPEKSVTPAG